MNLKLNGEIPAGDRRNGVIINDTLITIRKYGNWLDVNEEWARKRATR